MPDVQECNKSISDLNDQWDNIKLLSEINCPIQSISVLPNMTKIQNGFCDLQQELIDTLVSEKLKKMEQKIVSKTQVAIDILIRNLFERTADIGFLATDDDIRRFVENDERTESDRNQILARMREYVAKYSVYEDIIVLDQDFRVLANLDEQNNILGKKIKGPNLVKTMNGEQSFVEYFKNSKLQYGDKNSHVFSSRICREGTSQTIGLICLCFRFENEMKQIFEKLTNDYDGSVITIIDDANTVIASSDENHVPTGTVVEPVESGENGVVYYRGSDYIAKTLSTQGYQNYFGLGWKGHVMLPLGLAFRDNRNLKDIDSTVSTGLLRQADSFSTELNAIINKTQLINGSLKRIVYNGQIIARDDSIDAEYSRLKPILRAIGRIGTNTSSLFQNSVSNLFSTVVSTSLVDTSFLASLCVDIMDRNLYERANDCRWWALDSTIRRILAKDELDSAKQKQLTDILTYINDLYTVYTNLFVFDKTGTIVAVSQPEHADDIGKTLTMPFISDILANASPEKYFVSPFEKTDLYDDRHTYIYGASITDFNNSNKTVGGIGIVFDSEYQFRTILEESLNSGNDAFAVFTDRKKRIIAATSDAYAVGEKLNLPDELFSVPNGDTRSEIRVYENCYYSIGCACSSSYREYKDSDGYHNDVIAFVFEKMADYSEMRIEKTEYKEIEQSDFAFSLADESKKLATFVINGQVYGMEQSYVIEVLEASKMISVPGTNSVIRGAVEFNKQYYAVVDALALFDKDQPSIDATHLLMLQLSDEEMIAIQVEKLVSVLEINKNDIQPVDITSAITGVICLNDNSNRTILEMDPQIMLEKLVENTVEEDLEAALPLLETI
ncbi:chemotaxis protein CheW [Acetobacterium fimetarium]|uniref:Chemotaxis protein CheW n=2 Tax=Acetobacterium fimetarium TaxID=52691 RepID=A0ABR6WR68_9FIRM|nr:chemotaxis protein CheW [Acetobacterium fimetarium]